MYISKISAQPKIYFGAQNRDNVSVLEPDENVSQGNLGDSLDAMASVGRSAVNVQNDGKIEELDENGNLKHTRCIENGKYVDTYFTTAFSHLVRDYVVYSQIPQEGQPEDKSHLVIRYWEDGETARSVYSYDNKGKLIDADFFDRDEPPIPMQNNDIAAYL